MKLFSKRPSGATVLSIVAVILAFAALAGTALSGGSAVPGKNGVKASDIAKGAVKKPKIAKKAVTSGKFFLAKVENQNVGIVLAGACSTFGIATPGIRATDHVLVTPPPGWAETFTLVGTPDPGNDRVLVQFCNQFGSGGGDADGGGGPYKVLVIH